MDFGRGSKGRLGLLFGCLQGVSWRKRKMMILYFTATGNSLAVAKRTGGELISIPQAIKNERYEFTDKAVGFVFPVYGCMVPFVVRDFMRKISVKADYTFAIATYGMSAGAVLEEAKKISVEAGYSFDYLNKVLMLDNCQPQFDITKQKETLAKKNVDRQLKGIVRDIQSRKKNQPEISLVERVGTGFCKMLGMGKPNPRYDNNFRVDGNCIKCGTCARVCPMGNITITDHVEYHHNCAACQACIHACPKKAIHFRGERNTERWRNPDVTLSEIIASNQQNNIR